MTDLTARCGGCSKDITVDTKLVLLTVYDDSPEIGSVTFTCPNCAEVIHRNVDQASVHDLAPVSHVMRVHAPSEHTGPPISMDDLITLGLELRDD